MQEFINELIRQWNLQPWLWNVVLFAFSILIGLIISFLLSRLVKKQTGSEIKFRLGQSLLEHLAGPVSFLIPILVFNNMLPALQAGERTHAQFVKATEIALIVGFAWLLINCVRVAQDIVHYKININAKDNLRQRQIITQLIYIRRVVTFVIFLLAAGAILLSFDTLRKIGAGLLTGVGIGGIIIGFAAQKSLTNLLSGFQIAFTQPIRIDDEVIVEGEFGRIEELTLTYVVVRIWDSRRMILPITYFLEKPFQNWTRSSSEILGTVFLYVDYTIPVDWLRQEFMSIIQNHPLWDKRAAGLVVTDLKQTVMEVRCLVSCASSGDAFDLRCHIREHLVKRISENYPHSLPVTRFKGIDNETKSLEAAMRPGSGDGLAKA